MPVFLPFRALRPTAEKVSKFSAKTTDFKNQDEVLADMIANKESYYYVTKQNLLSKLKKPIEYFFEIGARFIADKMAEGHLFIDSKPNYYVYRQKDLQNDRIYTGIIGLVDVLNLNDGGIKKHELTKVVREEYLYKQLHYTGVLGEPVLMGHPHSEAVSKFLSEVQLKKPEYDFETANSKQHTVWLINNASDLEFIADCYLKMPAFYIADGHHRCASTIRNYERNPEPVNRYFMVFLLDENQFHIDSFHRMLSDVDPLYLVDFKEKLRQSFVIEDRPPGELYLPNAHSEFGLLTRDFSFKLVFNKERKSSNPETHLDVNILENKLLKPIMGIHHPRTDHRLSYMSSKEDFNKINDLLQNGEIDMVISNYPVSFDEVKRIADANKTMPAKSTYIEPKLRGGLIIQKF